MNEHAPDIPPGQTDQPAIPPDVQQPLTVDFTPHDRPVPSSGDRASLPSVDFLPTDRLPQPHGDDTAAEQPAYLILPGVDASQAARIVSRQLDDAGTTRNGVVRASELPSVVRPGLKQVADVRQHPKRHRAVTRPPAPSIDELAQRLQDTPPEEAGFVMVDFNDIEPVFLEPMDIVTGIKNLRDFNKVEEEIVGTLSPFGAFGSGEAMGRERIASDRIQNYLRPANFVGRLINGQVIILPFSIEAAINTNAGNRKALQQYDEERSGPIVGLTAIYSGLLQRSVGKVGQMDLLTTYHVRPTGVQTNASRHHGVITRSIGKPRTAEMAKRMIQQDHQSIENAYRITANGMRYLSSQSPFRPERGK